MNFSYVNNNGFISAEMCLFKLVACCCCQLHVWYTITRFVLLDLPQASFVSTTLWVRFALERNDSNRLKEM